jgi:hypothetical protein
VGRRSARSVHEPPPHPNLAKLELSALTWDAQ